MVANIVKVIHAVIPALGRPVLYSASLIILACAVQAQASSGIPVKVNDQLRNAASPDARSGSHVPIAMEDGTGRYTLWSVAEEGGTASIALEGVNLLPIRLVGYPIKDCLRIDLPAASRTEDACIELPQGGSLYRVEVGGSMSILHVGRKGRISLSHPDGTTGWLEQGVHVSPDGSTALVCSDLASGGDVFLLDLASRSPARNLTKSLPPLEVDGASLRTRETSAWFVASGELYRVDLAGGADASVVVLEPGMTPLPELALATDADRVAVVVSVDGEEDSRHLLVVSLGGAPIRVTELPGVYETPGYESAFGPLLELSPDGSLLAYVESEATQELHVAEVGSSQPAVHLTGPPEFPAYLDTVGVLAFGQPELLCFFSGDLQISGVDLEELMGAAEMYAADLSVPGLVTFTNVTMTNGDALPPFDLPANLTIAGVRVDPLGERILLVEEPSDDVVRLSLFPVTGWPTGPAVQLLLDDLDEDPLIARAGENVLISVTREAPDESAAYLLEPPGIWGSHLLGLGIHPDADPISRIVFDRSSNLAAYVVQGGTLAFEAFLVDVASGSAAPVPGLQCENFSPAVAISPGGRLYLGHGSSQESLEFVSIGASLGVRNLSLPAGAGFPLDY